MKSFVCLLLVAGAAFAQVRTPRQVLSSSGAADKSLNTSSGYVPKVRQASGAVAQAAPLASNTPQGPGVMQIDLGDPRRSSWFVSTDTIPSGSTIAAFIIPPGSVQQFLQFSITLNADVQPGTSLMLPQIAALGDFWPAGVMTYDVLIKYPNGTNTHAAADFCTNCARTFTDLQSVTPLIYDNLESLANDGSVLVTIDGVFTGDPVKVAFEGLAVPPNAISRGNNNSVIVNASQVPGMKLDLYQDFLLTVSQNGWSDTRKFTHVPFQPGTYIPSP
ncbi:MAG TPA: hypothetical protein VEU96_12345 [Bryobacteraceae bacterium]|nr:hypothetical protein [Bryobacteraceae bacterium]